MGHIDSLPPLVSVEWLASNLDNPDLVILDASLPLPGAKPQPESERVQIKNARFFDIETTFSDTSTALPHTMPSAEAFAKEAQKLGINSDSLIIVYDNIGLYSSARPWWMFRAMGHPNVAVLDGGLPAWIKAGYEVEPAHSESVEPGNFAANYQPERINDAQDVLAALNDPDQVVFDARSRERFLGEVPEPRAGLRGGHMPNAVSLPFMSIQEGNKMLPQPELERIYGGLADKKQHLIFSCGSGVTACVLALGAELAGYENLSVYDGSWSEWGLPSDLPVTT
ncbi:sulfurtransferase [Larkinella rosea]|uniref:Sulfurtransferase n=1 Tax=Larkinella rosea TaxID=2025312 RepID=A0A3P1BSE9_9BACT|nr:sulfurtransferase [Larkinella rosea]RRB03843.1 sulfurtransferase [Larkinella rosea]